MKNIFLIICVFIVLGCTEREDYNEPIPDPGFPEDIVASHTISELLIEFNNEAVIEIDSVGISGFVLSTDEFGNISNELYLRDETGTLIIEFDADSLYAKFPIGQEVELYCTGLMIDPVNRILKSATGSAIPGDSLQIRTETTLNNINISPTALTFTEGLTDENIGDYVEFLKVQFDEEVVGEALANEPGITLRNVTGPNDEIIILGFSDQSVFTNKTVPVGRGTINGVVKKIDDELVLIPLSPEDLYMPLTRRFPFEKSEFSYNGNTLPYQIMYPRGYDGNGSYPLVIFLHGAGERGTNNTSQMIYGPETFANPDARTDYPAIVVFPQCPSDVMWSRRIKEKIDGTWVFEFPVEEEPNYAMEMVIELTRQLIASESVDSERIYLAGLSMGGIGVFEYFYYAPNLAAAGVSLAGGHDPDLISTYGEGKSFWLFHGTEDNVVPIKYSRDMYNKFIELDFNVSFTEAEGRGHEWNYALNDPELIQWLFQQ